MESVIYGRDPDVIASCLNFYARPDGYIYDVTCNERRMWKGIDTTKVIFSDIDYNMHPTIQCSFSALPYKNETGSVIIFDPPHLPNAAGTEHSMQPFVKRYGLKVSTDTENIKGIFPEFLVEAKRVLKPEGLIFVKLSDYVHNHKYQWILVDFINEVRKIDGLTPTDLIIKRDPSAGNLKSGKWNVSHHARKAHCWWIIVRKGKCESRLQIRESINLEQQKLI